MAHRCLKPLEDRHQKGILEAVHKCLLHNTLLHTPKIRIDLIIPAMRDAA